MDSVPRTLEAVKGRSVNQKFNVSFGFWISHLFELFTYLLFTK